MPYHWLGAALLPQQLLGPPFHTVHTPRISWRESKSIAANGCLGRVTGKEEHTEGEGLGRPVSVTSVSSTENQGTGC